MSVILNTMSSRFVDYSDRGAPPQVGVSPWSPAKEFSRERDCFESCVYNKLLIHRRWGWWWLLRSHREVLFVRVVTLEPPASKPPQEITRDEGSRPCIKPTDSGIQGWYMD